MIFESLQWEDYAILFSNSLNAQNDCPDVFFKLGESTRKIENHRKVNTYDS